MEFLIPLVLVLLIVGAFVAFMVLNATRRGQKSDASREASGTPGIGQDATPLGDTSEHAGEQTTDGRTVGGQDANEKGGTGRPVQSGYTGTTAAGDDRPQESAHVRRSGEAEGTERLAFEDVEPPAAGDDASARSGEEKVGSEAAGDRRRAAEDEQGAEEPRPDSERLADRGF
jgi:hypothetical protein